MHFSGCHRLGRFLLTNVYFGNDTFGFLLGDDESIVATDKAVRYPHRKCGVAI
jgi:hypothetical protein